jgi:hypothetical protein
MSDQKYLLLTKENAEVILNKVRRLSWDDANEVMAIIKDLRAVSVKETEEDLPFINKFSGTGDRNEETKEERALLSGDVIWGGDGTPTTY